MSIEIVPRPADQAAIDFHRRLRNMLGAEFVDIDMNVLAVFDSDGVFGFRKEGTAAYIKHASGCMTTCGTDQGCEFILNCAEINQHSVLLFNRVVFITLPSNIVRFTVDLFDKNYSSMSSVWAGK